MHTRRQARISALQALYELDTTNHNAADAIAHRVEDSQLPPEGEAFLRQLVSGVVVNRDRLDALIQQYAPAWPVSQIAVIDRNVLRIALLELSSLRDSRPKSPLTRRWIWLSSLAATAARASSTAYLARP